LILQYTLGDDELDEDGSKPDPNETLDLFIQVVSEHGSESDEVEEFIQRHAYMIGELQQLLELKEMVDNGLR